MRFSYLSDTSKQAYDRALELYSNEKDKYHTIHHVNYMLSLSNHYWNEFNACCNERISQEEYLCNLPLLCKYSLIIWNGNGGKVIREENPNSFIDIELELIDLCDFCAIDYMNSKEYSSPSIHSNTNCLYITEKC